MSNAKISDLVKPGDKIVFLPGGRWGGDRIGSEHVVKRVSDGQAFTDTSWYGFDPDHPRWPCAPAEAFVRMTGSAWVGWGYGGKVAKAVFDELVNRRGGSAWVITFPDGERRMAYFKDADLGFEFITEAEYNQEVGIAAPEPETADVGWVEEDDWTSVEYDDTVRFTQGENVLVGEANYVSNGNIDITLEGCNVELFKSDGWQLYVKPKPKPELPELPELPVGTVVHHTVADVIYLITDEGVKVFGHHGRIVKPFATMATLQREFAKGRAVIVRAGR